jgi:hypothetical protein
MKNISTSQVICKALPGGDRVYVNVSESYLEIKMIHGIKGTPGRGARHRISSPTHPPQFTKPEHTEPSHRGISSSLSITISSVSSDPSTPIVFCGFSILIPYKTRLGLLPDKGPEPV